MHARSALAGTIGLEISELIESQYQPGRFPRAIYAVGERYYCTGNRPPKPEGMQHLSDLAWTKHSDQFWAEKAGTVIWVAKADTE